MPHVSSVAIALLLPAALLFGAACGELATNASSDNDGSHGGVAHDGDMPTEGEGGAREASVPDLLDGGGASSLDVTSQPPTSFDAAVPDAASCTSTFGLDLDATPRWCELSPEDVACNAASDCTVLVVGGCPCGGYAYGTNAASPELPLCTTPACIPPPSGGCPGYETEDCEFVPSTEEIGVACVAHTCLTFATAAH